VKSKLLSPRQASPVQALQDQELLRLEQQDQGLLRQGLLRQGLLRQELRVQTPLGLQQILNSIASAQAQIISITTRS
jgi:hypothetical protein